MTTYAAHYLLSPAGAIHRTPQTSSTSSPSPNSSSKSSSYQTFSTTSAQTPTTSSRTSSLTSTTPLTQKTPVSAENEGKEKTTYDSRWHSSTAKENGTAKWYDFLKPLE